MILEKAEVSGEQNFLLKDQRGWQQSTCVLWLVKGGSVHIYVQRPLGECKTDSARIAGFSMVRTALAWFRRELIQPHFRKKKKALAFAPRPAKRTLPCAPCNKSSARYASCAFRFPVINRSVDNYNCPCASVFVPPCIAVSVVSCQSGLHLSVFASVFASLRVSLFLSVRLYPSLSVCPVCLGWCLCSSE